MGSFIVVGSTYSRTHTGKVYIESLHYIHTCIRAVSKHNIGSVVDFILNSKIFKPMSKAEIVGCSLIFSDECYCVFIRILLASDCSDIQG